MTFSKKIAIPVALVAAGLAGAFGARLVQAEGGAVTAKMGERKVPKAYGKLQQSFWDPEKKQLMLLFAADNGNVYLVYTDDELGVWGSEEPWVYGLERN